MTKQELLKKMDEIIYVYRKNLERISDENSKEFFYNSVKYNGFNEIKLAIEELDEPKTKIIEVKTLHYSNLHGGLKELTKEFNSLMEYTSWLRFITVKYPDVIIKEVNFKEVE